MKTRKNKRLRPLATAVTASSPNRNRNWRRHVWRIAGLWALILAAYSNSFRAGMVFDSAIAIGHDARLRAPVPQAFRLILTGEYWYRSTTSGLYRPLTTLSYLLNFQGFGNGTHPAGYHWVNFVLHAINVGLAYALGMVVMEDEWMALPLAALWGLHPLLTESVTNIVGRADILAAFGVLAGWLCYARSGGATNGRKLAWLAGIAAAQAIGIFSKESAIVLPGLMLLYDWLWPRAMRWRGRLVAYAALVVPLGAFFYQRGQLHTHMVTRLSDNPLLEAGFWTARFTAMKVIANYLWLFVWPGQLSADYSYNAVPLFWWQLSWEDAKAPIAIVFCLGAVALAVFYRRRQRALAFFIGFFFLTLLPASNLAIRIGSIMAERFVYLPSAGLAGCLVLAVGSLVRHTGLRRPGGARIAWIAAVLACLAFAVRTYSRNADWLDEFSLWSSATQATPASAKAHCNLGQALSQIPGRLPDAMAEYRAALRIRPDYAEAHNDLGSALQQSGRVPDALAEYRQALRWKPDYAEAHYNLGTVLAQAPGHSAEAIAEYRAALRAEPDYAEAYNNLGLAIANSGGSPDDAAADYETALRIDPALAEAHNNLGNVLAQLPGRLPDAIAHYRAALQIRPRYAEAHNNLGDALSQVSGQLPAAVSEYEAALRIDANYAAAHNNLGLALVNSGGRPEAAIAHFEAALRINPEMAAVHNNLGVALTDAGRLTEAVAHFQAALRIKPDYAEAHSNLGDALSRIPGRLPDAIAQYEAALRIRPEPALRQIVNTLRAGRRPGR